MLAVNCPPHAPADGHAFNSIFLSACSEIFPEVYFPTPSKTSTTVISFPFNLPGRIDQP